MKEFVEAVGKKVVNLFLVAWPPWGEIRYSDIDMSFGFVFEGQDDVLYIIRVDKNELWAPHIFYMAKPEIKYSWKDFHNRMTIWMNAKADDLVLDFEYYDVTNCVLFEKIVGSEIIKIELISLEGNLEPFGVKIIFNDEYIISTPISDGNTIETSIFNKNKNVELFEKIGKIYYESVK